MGIVSKIKSNPKLKKFVLWSIAPNRNPRPRLWVRWFLNPLKHKKGKGATVRRRSRIDVFPWNRFEIGDLTTIEDFCTVNNGSGDVLLGNRVRVGIGSVVIGPVTMGSGSGLGQHVFVSGFNHGFSDGTKNSSQQPLQVKPTVIGEDSHIGANSVVLAGVTIGKRCQIGAGSVVTKDIPPFSVAVGNPARVIKQFNHETKAWEKTT
ncbi:acyltransferase [Polaribacter litorisediminis]|uniref:acyltransferase n=1 Tax=Polaribacter litorisediminis TaxID=1908341 RepID=UPI002675FA59|nr:acyltransferase [Polaribacter litorisediminis]UAM96763.1 acyltransferase [Polaribacter litorisediminis]